MGKVIDETEIVPHQQEARRKVDGLVSQGRALQVVDQATFDEASRHLRLVKEAIKQVKDVFVSPKKASRAAYQAIVDLEKTFLASLEEVDDYLRKEGERFMLEQKRKAEDEARLRAEAETKERERLIALANKKVDGLLKKSAVVDEQIASLEGALEDITLPDTEVDAIRTRLDVLRWHKQSYVDKVDQQVAEVQQARVAPSVSVMPHAMPTAPKGVSFRRVYEPEVVDFRKLVIAVAHGRAPITVLTVAPGELKKVINAGIDVEGVVKHERAAMTVRG